MDDALDRVERGVGELRSRLRARAQGYGATTTSDAAVAGFVCGVACGKILIGDPALLGIGM